MRDTEIKEKNKQKKNKKTQAGGRGQDRGGRGFVFNIIYLIIVYIFV